MALTLISTWQRARPTSFVQTSTGRIMFANGIDRMQIWDGEDTTSMNAGFDAPTTNLTLASGGAGSVTGDYTAYYRFVDGDGIPSNFSPISSEVTLSSNDINYSSVDVDSNSRATKREIYRNTDGQSTVYYLDATISDNTSTSTSGVDNDDATLDDNSAIPILLGTGALNANKYGIPPKKAVLCAHRGRIFAVGNAIYTKGHAAVTNASATVTLTGGQVTDDMVDREFLVPGDAATYNIDSVNTGANTLTLDSNYAGTTDLFAAYQIANYEGERDTIYWSAAHEPEAWSALDGIALPFDGDEPIGMMEVNSFLFIFKRYKTYRFTMQSDPIFDAAIFPATERGLCSFRSCVNVEGTLFCLDRQGFYKFDGSRAEPIDMAILDKVRDNIDWANDLWFHASYEPQTRLVYFFVSYTGDSGTYPRRALVYSLDNNAWYSYTFSYDMASAVIVPISSRERMLVGSEHENVFLWDEGYLDYVTDETLTLTGDVSSATSTTVVLDTTLDSSLVGADIGIYSGTGKTEVQRIAAISGTTVTIVGTWTTTPDSTSNWYVGTFNWDAKLKHHRYMWHDKSELRECHVSYKPTTSACQMDLRRFEDYDTTAVNNAVTNTVHNVTVTADDPDAVVQMQLARTSTNDDGFARYPYSGRSSTRGPSHRRVATQLRGMARNEAIRIYDVTILGAMK